MQVNIVMKVSGAESTPRSGGQNFMASSSKSFKKAPNYSHPSLPTSHRSKKGMDIGEKLQNTAVVDALVTKSSRDTGRRGMKKSNLDLKEVKLTQQSIDPLEEYQPSQASTARLRISGINQNV